MTDRLPQIVKNYFLPIVLLLFCIAGCSMADETRRVSEDLNALRKVADLPVQARSGRWEIFSTPEDDFVPGPTVATTLVAELNTLQDVAAPNTDERIPFLVMQETARPWLSRDFHALMKTTANNNLMLGMETGCHPYQSRIYESPEPVKGFVCFKPGRVLLYLQMMMD